MNEVIKRLLLAIIVPPIILIGCAPQFMVSVPKDVPSGVRGNIEGNILSVNLDTMQLAIQLQNYNAKPGQKPLVMWLEIGNTAGSLTLDPSKVKLKTSGNDVLEPFALLGPSESWQSPRAIARGCGPRRYSFGFAISKVDITLEDLQNLNPSKGFRSPQAGPVFISENRCFMFWFDTDRSPALPFTISIGGVTKNAMPVSIPEMQFEQGKIGKVVPVP